VGRIGRGFLDEAVPWSAAITYYLIWTQLPYMDMFGGSSTRLCRGVPRNLNTVLTPPHRSV